MDPTGVNQVLINGQPATSDEVNWTYTATLVPGQNELVISEETADGVNEIDRIFVDRSPNLITPGDVVDDNANGRLLILDTSQNLLIAADKESGALSVLSPPAGETNLIKNSRGLALDVARNRVLIYQGRQSTKDTNPEFIQVDLTTGAQSVFTVPDFTDIYLAHSPKALIVANDVAFVADTQAKFFNANKEEVPEGSEDAVSVQEGEIIYRINLTSGERTLISSRYFPEEGAGNSLDNVKSLAYNPTKSVLYALDVGGVAARLLEVKLADGKRSLVAVKNSSGSNISLRLPDKIDIDVANQKVLLLNDTVSRNPYDPSIISIDLADNKSKILTSNAYPENGDYVLRRSVNFHYSPADNAIYMVEDAQDVVFRVDMQTGARTPVASSGPVDKKGYITNSLVRNVILADDHQTYLLDLRFSSVFAYNLYFGHKAIINNNQTNGLEVQILRSPTTGAWDPAKKHLLLANEANGAFLTYDPATQKAESKLNLPVVATDVLIDPASDTAYVAVSTGIIKVDLADKYRSTTFSSSSTPDRINNFQNLRGIALDADNNRLLAIDSGLNAVLAVDLATGARSLFSPPAATPDAEDILSIPKSIVIDKTNNRALVLDSGRKAIVGVDLTTGKRADVYRYADASPRVVWTPAKMVLHPTFNYLLLIDEFTGTLSALDLNGDTPQFVTLTR